MKSFQNVSKFNKKSMPTSLLGQRRDVCLIRKINLVNIVTIFQI